MTGFSFSRSLRDRALLHPDAPALTFVTWHGGDYRTAQLTYGALDALVDRVATRLLTSGVEPGDRVAVLCRNDAAQPAVLYGASRARAVPLTVNWRLSLDELRGVVTDAQPRVVVATSEFEDAARAVKDLVAEVVVLDALPDGPDLAGWVGTEDVSPLDLGNQDDDLAMLCYTSGTTGQPKGVMTTNSAVAAHLASNCYDYLSAGRGFLNTAPTFHAAGAGLVWAPLHLGSHVTLLDTNEPAAIVEMLDSVDAALLVPTVLQMVVAELRRQGRTIPRLDAIVYGGSPITAQAQRDALEILPAARFFQTYGMTETTGPLTQLTPQDHAVESRLPSAGNARRGVELRIADPHDLHALRTGEVGEIQARSNQLTTGYWRRPRETAELFTPDGWLRTGDLGFLDEEGYLHIKDRLKDMIVTGGENVYAVEVENVLSTFPGVQEVCVIGIPDERWGEAVAAALVGDGVDVEGLIDHARERLAHYKVPRTVTIVDELPKSPAGKILRRQVRATQGA